MTKLEYTEPDYPNEFIKYIGKGTQLSVGMIPNIPEFASALEEKISKKEKIIPELEGTLLKNGEKLNNQQMEILYKLSLFSKYKIYPFLELTFTDRGPEIKYCGPKWRDIWAMDELEKFCMNPNHFSENKKWYSIYFKEFKNEDVENAKKAIEGFKNKGYKIDSIHTELNPRVVTRDHYSDELESDLTIFIKDGNIDVYGIKKEFKFPTTKEELKDFFEGYFHPQKSIQ